MSLFIYIENYYNSIQVGEKLFEKKTGICRSMQKNRNVLVCLKVVQLSEHSTTFLKKNNVFVQAWKTKKKMLYMTSRIHCATRVNVRRNRRTTKIICVIEYNKYMKSVDRTDRSYL